MNTMPHKSDDPHMDPRLAERINRKKAQLDRYSPLPSDTVRRLNEDLRVFLTYHSNAIEGNSLSLQETQMVIDYGVTIHGHPLREYLEATNHAEAYQYVVSCIEKRERITLTTIFTLHSLVMDKILESKGRFRAVPVYIRGSNMTPPPAHRVEQLMCEWVAWIYGIAAERLLSNTKQKLRKESKDEEDHLDVSSSVLCEKIFSISGCSKSSLHVGFG
jgi:Fic family protein